MGECNLGTYFCGTACLKNIPTRHPTRKNKKVNPSTNPTTSINQQTQPPTRPTTKLRPKASNQKQRRKPQATSNRQQDRHPRLVIPRSRSGLRAPASPRYGPTRPTSLSVRTNKKFTMQHVRNHVSSRKECPREPQESPGETQESPRQPQATQAAQTGPGTPPKAPGSAGSPN